MRHPARNRCGQASSLTVIAPVEPSRVDELSAHLDALASGDASPLARVAGTHFARWVVIEDVVFEGGRQRRDHLDAPRLLFTSNHDGTPAAYLEALRTGPDAAADAIWGCCRDYPGRGDAERWAAWMTARQVDSSLFFGAYGALTVERVRESLRARDALRRLALDTRGRPAAEQQRLFLEAFGA